MEAGRPPSGPGVQVRRLGMSLDALAERVEVDRTVPERLAHARDLWPRHTLQLAHGERGVLPDAVAFPRNDEQVRACLDWAVVNRVAVVPWGAGSGVCGAAAGMAGAVTIDLKRMAHVGKVDPATQTVRVQPGVLGQHFEDALARQGWATRHSPSSIWCSTVGGWAASRSAGQFSSRYGKFEDMVAAMRVVSPARTFRTGLWAEGEDLGPWVMGSEGALGIITEMLVRVVRVPENRWLRGYRFPDVAAAWDAMRRVMQAELHPCALRLYDAVDTRIGGRGKGAKKGPGVLSALTAAVNAAPGAKEMSLRLPLSVPRLANSLARWGGKECVLIAGWEGTPESVAILSRHGHQILCEQGTDLGAEPGEHWYTHRHDVSYKLSPLFGRGVFADTMEVASTWSRLPELDRAVRAALGAHCFVMAHYSHVYREGCSIYFSFAGVGELPVYDRAWAAALAAASAAGGTVAHHHGVGVSKMLAAAREMAGVRPAFDALRRTLDPLGILNPGRIFPDVPLPDDPRPVLGVDTISAIATLDAQQSAAERDAWLASQGWALRNPTETNLADAVRTPSAPWETPTLGCSVMEASGRRTVLLPVPRSSAGPDPRRSYPASAYETLTVPVVRLADEAVLVDSTPPDVRAARQIGHRHELRGPAANDLAALSAGAAAHGSVPTAVAPSDTA